MKNFGMSMLWFWVAYAAVTILGIAHTVFNIYVLHMKPMDGTSMGEGYEKTKPWHDRSVAHLWRCITRRCFFVSELTTQPERL